jgi:hypothetical protein
MGSVVVAAEVHAAAFPAAPAGAWTVSWPLGGDTSSPLPPALHRTVTPPGWAGATPSWMVVGCPARTVTAPPGVEYPTAASRPVP